MKASTVSAVNMTQRNKESCNPGLSTKADHRAEPAALMRDTAVVQRACRLLSGRPIAPLLSVPGSIGRSLGMIDLWIVMDNLWIAFIYWRSAGGFSIHSLIASWCCNVSSWPIREVWFGMVTSETFSAAGGPAGVNPSAALGLLTVVFAPDLKIKIPFPQGWVMHHFACIWKMKYAAWVRRLVVVTFLCLSILGLTLRNWVEYLTGGSIYTPRPLRGHGRFASPRVSWGSIFFNKNAFYSMVEVSARKKVLMSFFSDKKILWLRETLRNRYAHMTDKMPSKFILSLDDGCRICDSDYVNVVVPVNGTVCMIWGFIICLISSVLTW